MQYNLSWQQQLAQAETDIYRLCDTVGCDPKALGIADKPPDFPLRVPKSFIERMEYGNPKDPLLLQVLPQAAEYVSTSGYGEDPLEEAGQSPVPGLLHKYESRVLVMPTGACAVHCRYCFRRHFPYQERGLLGSHWKQILAYIQSQPLVNEVIFSGGDPLLLSDALLERYFSELALLPQIKRIRCHSRTPVVIPDRITPSFIELCQKTTVPVILMIHCNHPQELSEALCDKLKLLSQAGVRLYNQTVLLKEINDSVSILAELSERLWEACVQPYYVHALDAVAGAQHFDLPNKTAIDLHERLRAALPGFLVPTFVREVPHQKAKVPL